MSKSASRPAKSGKQGRPISRASRDSAWDRNDSLRPNDIIAGLPDALVLLDRDWRIICINSAAERICGSQPEEFVERVLWDVWPGCAGTQLEHELRRAMDQRVPVHLEHLHSDDPLVWHEIHSWPCEPGIALQYRDITDGKRLADREKELSEFVENAAVPLHRVGADGTILWANAAELKLLGYTHAEYVGHNIAEFHTDEQVIGDILNRLRQGHDLSHYEARLRCKDGSIRHVAITSDVYRENGRFLHTRCVTRDISEQNRAAELQDRFAAIVESSDDAIISKDLNGIIRSWNRGAERIFGYTAEEIVGKPVTMLAVPGRQDEMPAILGRIRRGERVDHYETRRRAKDGRSLDISLTVSPIRDGSGQIVGASKIARDITDRVRAEEALRETNAALSRANSDLEEFAYCASHDLQEPLRMVTTYSELLRRRFGGQLGETGDQYLRFTIEGAHRMQQLLKDLLAYTRASTERVTPDREVDANKALERALSNLQMAITDSAARITHQPLPAVRLHLSQLAQVFQNLIANAIRYRRDAPPEVYIQAELRDAEWRFSVRDNGMGIDPRYGDRIFGMFKRLHSGADYPGTGMGLAICQRIIHRAGGRIWVESEPGQGSTFFFTVPADRRR